LQGTQGILQEGPTLAIVIWMNRRHFVGLAVSAVIAQGFPRAFAAAPVKPFALGVVIKPYGAPEEHLRTVHELGFPTVFLSMDDYLGGFTPELAKQYRELLAKYQLTATTIEVVGPQPLKWNFMQGPTTIGIVPPNLRAARIDALRQASDFAKLVGIPQVQTHCGFIPENPGEALYAQAVEAIRTVAKHCQGNGQAFLMETGQETPTTMSRAIHDVDMPNLGVGLDTANLLLYGKANPVDAVDILGPHVMSVHAKDGRWPTNPNEFGEEVLIGKGLVDFRQVFTKLHKLGYKGAVSIEREISGPQQIEDVKIEKAYLDRVIREVNA
jgi:L-ribulose-5-phosphate 3-epimerase